jgi:hypothetical protein
MEGWRVILAFRHSVLASATTYGCAFALGWGSLLAATPAISPRTGSVMAMKVQQTPRTAEDAAEALEQQRILDQGAVLKTLPDEAKTLPGESPTDLPPSVLDDISAPSDSLLSTFDGPELIHDHAGPWEPPAPTWSSGSWFFNGQRYAQVDFVLLHRTRPRARKTFGVDIFADDTGVTDHGQPWGVEPGIRAVVGTLLGRDHANRDRSVEIGFFGVDKFSSPDGLQSRGNNGLFLADDNTIPGFNNADTYTFEHNSRIHSYEFNYKLRRRLESDRIVMGPDGHWTRQFQQGNTPSFLVGLRYISVNENFLFTSRRFEQTPDQFGGDYLQFVENDLLGIQFGGEWYAEYETYYFGIRGKGGPYINFAEQSSTITIAGFDPIDRVATRNMAAFQAEFSMLGAYYISPNWTVRMSMDLYVIGGLAIAPDQLDFSFSPPPRVISDGVIFLQSISLGMEAVW